MTAVVSAGEFDSSSADAAAELSWIGPLAARPDSLHEGEGRQARPIPAWPAQLSRRLVVSDAVVLSSAMIAAMLAGGVLRHASSAWTEITVAAPLIALVVGWFWSLRLFRSRHRAVLGSGSQELTRVVMATMASVGMLTFAETVMGFTIDRRMFLPALTIGFLGLLTGRLVWRLWLARQRGRGAFVSSLLAVGDSSRVEELAAAMRLSRLAGYRIVGTCSDGQGPTIRVVGDEDQGGEDRPGDCVPILGQSDQALEIAQRLGVDAVVLTEGAGLQFAEIKALTRNLHSAGIGVIHLSGMVDVAPARVESEHFAGRSFLHVAPPTYAGASGIAKRTLDLLGSTVLIALLGPVLVGIALAVKWTSPGPVFFRQKRVGLGEKPFQMIKFRSMTCDAEDRLAEVKDSQDMGNTVMFKARNDPRVTRVGRVIRRFSLDELPQLFNVLKSEMSLVGPRPPLPGEVEQYDENDRRRFLVKPGMTGLWQVSGRSELDWAETRQLDQYYVDNWSTSSDVAILCRTLKAATKGV